MAGITSFLSSAIESLIGDLEAGTEEGVRNEVEKLKEDERRVAEEREEKERQEVEKCRREEEELREREEEEVEKRKRRDEEPEREVKEIEFRARLAHEPPEDINMAIDYADYAFYDELQKEVKNTSTPSSIELCTNWVDLQIEESLLKEYRYWSVVQMKDETLPLADREFYNGLRKSIKAEWEDVFAEQQENNDKLGLEKTRLVRLMDAVMTSENVSWGPRLRPYSGVGVRHNTYLQSGDLPCCPESLRIEAAEGDDEYKYDADTGTLSHHDWTTIGEEEDSPKPAWHEIFTGIFRT